MNKNLIKPLSLSVGLLVNLAALSLGLLNPTDAEPLTDLKAVHVLNRLSFGTGPGDVVMIKKLGVDAYIEQQLHPDAIPQPPALTNQLSQLETLNLTPVQLLEQTSPANVPGQTATAEQRKASRQKQNYVLEQATQARLLQAIESPRQLQEVMVDFWYNHFNVFSGKGIDRVLVGAYEQAAIRPYALGRFRDLLEATARHPAMLYYLDNWQSSATNAGKNVQQKQGLNENYARELMELHTLGVDGGYTQQDVIALAKILTGWTFRRSAQAGTDPNGFYFNSKRHDFSDKVFLGHAIKGSGMAEAEQALDILAKSPATARHISYQLAQYFVADQPPSALVEQLTQKFLDTNGDIRAVLSTLFHSAEFQDAHYDNTKFKTPYQYVVSAVRATGITVKNVRPLSGILQQLGMPIYGYLTPDGYKNTADVWLNPDAMTRRISFATALASGRLPLTTLPVESTSLPSSNQATLSNLSATSSSAMPIRASMSREAVISPVDPTQLAATLGNAFSAQTQQAIASSPPALRAALILGSPEFMRR